VNDEYFQKLCNDLRDSTDEEKVRRAAEALRRYLRDQQFIIRQRLSPYIEKAFSGLNSDDHNTN
jgi:hypothetical protein